METVKRIKEPHPEREYSRFEEAMHAALHGGGALLSIVGLVFLLLKAAGNTAALVSSAVFGASLIILYLASCAYHTSCLVFGEDKPSRIRDLTMKCDHSLIYILILGTYTPACLSAMGGIVGTVVFAVVATCAVIGIVMNAIDVERFKKVSLILYLVAGWTIAAAIYPYYKAVGWGGIAFLLIGGAAYTVGVLFYRARHIPYMHIVWHIFVLLGSIFHYFMVYLYCLS